MTVKIVKGYNWETEMVRIFDTLMISISLSLSPLRVCKKSAWGFYDCNVQIRSYQIISFSWQTSRGKG